jgi:hypothetical protein
MLGILKYHTYLRYDEYLRCIEKDKQVSGYLKTVEEMGIIRQNYNPIEKLIGCIRWRIGI